jgi:histidine triad (HIT) family protein
MDDCIFCKIIKGEIPAHKIYEDDKILAFLDAFPIAKGHTLIIPKQHAENIYDINEETISHIGRISKRIAKQLKDKLKCDGINILQNNEKFSGQFVMHYHMHLIPRFESDNLSFWSKTDKTFDLEEIHKLLK